MIIYHFWAACISYQYFLDRYLINECPSICIFWTYNCIINKLIIDTKNKCLFTSSYQILFHWWNLVDVQNGGNYFFNICLFFLVQVNWLRTPYNFIACFPLWHSDKRTCFAYLNFNNKINQNTNKGLSLEKRIDML